MSALAHEEVRADRAKAHIHRPAQGWTVDASILTLQSKLTSRTVQPWVGRRGSTLSCIPVFFLGVDVSMLVLCFLLTVEGCVKKTEGKLGRMGERWYLCTRFMPQRP